MTRMKILQIILAILEVFFFFILVSSPVSENRPLARAIAMYHQDPSPQNKIDLERQRKASRERLTSQILVIAALLILNSVGLFYVSRRIRSQVAAQPIDGGHES